MKRYFFISDNLDDLEKVEQELEAKGIETPQIHVLTSDESEADVQNHHLHTVEAVLKKDVVHSMELGAAIGVVGAALILSGAYFSGVTEGAAGWVPWVFLSVVVLGFCTWEGGFLGMQMPHFQFKRFQNALSKGKHVFFVDIDRNQEDILTAVTGAHPQLRPAGTGEATPMLVVKGQKKWGEFIKSMP